MYQKVIIHDIVWFFSFNLELICTYELYKKLKLCTVAEVDLGISAF